MIEKMPADIRGAFAEKVQQVANYLGVSPNWLMQVMYAESGLKPQAVNPYTRATGLLQFMPSTAAGLGTTVTALYSMNAVQQLDYVQKYFAPKKGRLTSYYDVYAWVWFPAIIGKPDDWIVHTDSLPASTIARQNPIIDRNKDGKITVAEFKQYVKSTVAQSNWSLVFDDKKKASV